MVCDTRLVAMGYGKRLLAALPPMRRLEGEAEFDAEIAALSEMTLAAVYQSFHHGSSLARKPRVRYSLCG